MLAESVTRPTGVNSAAEDNGGGADHCGDVTYLGRALGCRAAATVATAAWGLNESRVPLSPEMSDGGEYTVGYRVVSEDGDPATSRLNPSPCGKACAGAHEAAWQHLAVVGLALYRHWEVDVDRDGLVVRLRRAGDKRMAGAVKVSDLSCSTPPSILPMDARDDVTRRAPARRPPSGAALPCAAGFRYAPEGRVLYPLEAKSPGRSLRARSLCEPRRPGAERAYRCLHLRTRCRHDHPARVASSTRNEMRFGPGTWADRGGRDRAPAIPGHEVSGVIAELGYGTTGLTVGQRVFGVTDLVRNGTLAEYVAVEARNLAPLSGDINHTVAAAVPISGLTAWQALFDHGRLTAGQTALIHGAAGAARFDGSAAGARGRRPGHRHSPRSTP